MGLYSTATQNNGTINGIELQIIAIFYVSFSVEYGHVPRVPLFWNSLFQETSEVLTTTGNLIMVS